MRTPAELRPPRLLKRDALGVARDVRDGDQNERLVGMLSLADIAREAEHEHGTKTPEIGDAAVAEAIEAISASRSSGTLTAAA